MQMASWFIFMDISITWYMYIIAFIVNRCPPVPSLSNGIVSTVIADHGSNVSFICAHGYHFTDIYLVHDLICSNQSQWIGNNIPQCIGKIWQDLECVFIYWMTFPDILPCFI